MMWFIFGLFLLVLNAWIGINDIKKFNIPIRPVITWFVVGFLFWDVIVTQLPKLFS